MLFYYNKIETSSDASALVDTMKRVISNVDKSSPQYELFQTLGKTAELVRFIESLRTTLVHS